MKKFGFLLILIFLHVIQTKIIFSEAFKSLDRAPKPSSPSLRLPYLQRGDSVDEFYSTYTFQLNSFYHILRARLTQEAPNLLPKLTTEPPRSIPYGYKMVPKLRPAKPSSEPLPRPTSTSYSWPRTERLLNSERGKLHILEKQFHNISAHPPSARYVQYEQIVVQYLKREKNRRLIDRHITHNRFWQNTIHQDKKRFDRLTRLQDALLERQTIQDSIKTEMRSGQVLTLREREQALTHYIETHREAESPASFLSVQHPHPYLWIVQVPLYTDIQDSKFLQDCKETIETRWRARDGKKEFRVDVLIKVVDPEELYDPDYPPAHGTHINISSHVARFPSDGGVLTTGAKSTYAKIRRYIALEPQRLSANTLAHEFGHILGFIDRYFRGYRDLGSDGYEIVEVVPNYVDIMAAPGKGRVLPSHFNMLLSGSPWGKTR